MKAPGCDWCGAPADVVDNYDEYRCWDCWDVGGRDKPHNLIIQVLRDRTDAGGSGGNNDR